MSRMMGEGEFNRAVADVIEYMDDSVRWVEVDLEVARLRREGGPPERIEELEAEFRRLSEKHGWDSE